MFPLAIRLAEGKKLLLGPPLYLSSLYARLDECAENIMCSIGHYDMLCGLQLPLDLSLGEVHQHRPWPIEFEEVTFFDLMVRGVMKKKKIRPFMASAWRWYGIT